MTADPSKIFVVDRREGKFVVLVDDDGNTTEVEAASLPPRCRREGTVLRVPIGGGSVPLWRKAASDPVEKKRRLAEATALLEKLKAKDPGGDIVL